MKAIVGDSRATTWLAAVKHLSTCDRWEDYNLILEVADPMRKNERDQHIETTVNTFLSARDMYSLHTVAETIFPGAEYRKHGVQGVYETYPDVVYPRIKPLPELNWGTYAYRLLRRKGQSGETINPLKSCVEKIQKQLSSKSVNTACYELSLCELELELPIYDPAFDRKRHRNGPCLSHISIKVSRDKKMLLTAMYRSHYYAQKVLGNLLGLARLQQFLCEQTQLPPGPLVCVSTFAKLECESPFSKANVSKLIADTSSEKESPSHESVGARTA